ncbi:MAG: TolC family protein [Nannocystaceae bacterium]
MLPHALILYACVFLAAVPLDAATHSAETSATAPPSSAPPAATARRPAASGSNVDSYEDALRDALARRPGGLTANDVAGQAVLSSPAMAVKRAELVATAANLDRTMARYVPNLTTQFSYTRNSEVDINLGGDGAMVGALNEGPVGIGPCPDNSGANCVLDSQGVPLIAAGFAPIEVPLNNYSLQASLSVPFSEYALRLMPAKHGSASEMRATQMRHDAEATNVELNARLAYYDWLRALAQLSVSERTVASTGARLADGRAGLSAGILTQTDVLRLEELLASAEVARIQGQSFERLARRNLGIIMDREEIAFTVGEDLFAPVPTLDSWGPVGALVREGHHARLEIRVLTESADALHWGIKAARADLYPKLSGFADYTYANPNQRFFPATEEWNQSWYAGLSLSWQLGQFLDAKLFTKKIHADERVLRSQVIAMRRAITLEVHMAWEELSRAHTALSLNQRTARLTQAVWNQQVALYRAGESTTTDVVGAELARVNATLREVNDRIDLRVAQAKLERAAGRLRPMAPEASTGPAR